MTIRVCSGSTFGAAYATQRFGIGELHLVQLNPYSNTIAERVVVVRYPIDIFRQRPASYADLLRTAELVPRSFDGDLVDVAKNHEKNRKLEQRRVDSFALDMREGRWILTHQGIAFDVKGRLIDGQHRLAALVLYGKDVEMLVTTDLDVDIDDPIDRTRPRSLA